MKNKSIGFIGAGRITRIFLKAFENKQFEPGKVIVYDTDSDVTNNLVRQFPKVDVSDSPLTVSKQEIVFIALHPPAIMNTLEVIKEVVTGDTIVISLAPKINIDNISGKLDTHNIVRLIPNATSFINEGYNPVCFSPRFNASREEMAVMLEILGETFEVPEYKLEVYAIISAMLPTYFWFQWETLARLGEDMGLDRDETEVAIYQTTIAALNTLFKSGLDPDAVNDLIPVKPIGDHHEQIAEIYKAKLPALFAKIQP